MKVPTSQITVVTARLHAGKRDVHVEILGNNGLRFFQTVDAADRYLRNHGHKVFAKDRIGHLIWLYTEKD